MTDHATPSQPGALATIYVAVVFRIPFLIVASFLARQILYLLKKGLFPPPRDLSAWSKEVHELCRNDDHMAHLRRRGFQWLILTWIIWGVGFALMLIYNVIFSA